ncbi:MAG: AAA family ATPase [Candidatus Omnitrophica bacterium]|nr:AAA family ATPase [Candidatus Omnitrophota bacterium]MBD3269198.1 AAA family ATPase [Candidatus Omnitrophota bacterium]
MDEKRIFPLQSPQVVVVEASAGSGKTYTLAKRYLQLLLCSGEDSGRPASLRSILAITFTNKATFEMKGRIIELLKKLSLDAFSERSEENDILRVLNMDKQKASEKALQVMDELIRNYNFFQVQTIDSFINSLLLGCALNINRSASFSIKRQYRDYLSYCFDMVLDKAASDKEIALFLEEFLDHYLFVENRQGWFPRQDILFLIGSLFSISNKYGKSFETSSQKSRELIRSKRSIFNDIKELLACMPAGVNGKAVRSIERFILKDNQFFEFCDIPNSFSYEYPPLNKGKSAPQEFQKKWRRVHKKLSRTVLTESSTVYDPYVHLFNQIIYFLQVVSRKEDILFLEELNRTARLIFDEEGLTVAELYYRLATRFRHYLIDEFQDTSILQWENLFIMVEEALSEGGSLFYVGDKKQAIYRFRGGEAGLFDRVKDKFRNFNVTTATLNKNWRSQRSIVDFNNLIFSRENLKNTLAVSGIKKELASNANMINEILDVFKDSYQKCKENNKYGYVRIERLQEKNQKERDEITREKVLKLIKDLRQRFNYKDIAFLTRDNSEVEIITSWLLESNIPVESEKTLNLKENPLIKELISFLKFLNSPIDDLNFASFVLGDIFLKASNLSRKTVEDFLFEAAKSSKGEKEVYLYIQFREKYPGLWSALLEDFFRNVGFLSPYELTVNIYRSFTVLDNFAYNQAFFMKFLELISEKEEDYIGLGGFLSYLDEAAAEDLYVKVTSSDSVKVLTIHKAKGLEFPVVVVPFLKIEIKAETGGKISNSYIASQDSRYLRILKITKSHRRYSEKLQDIYREAYKRSCIDEFNNIYVALTRPCHELYVFIPKKSGNALNRAASLIPENLKEAGKVRKYEARRKEKGENILKVSPPSYRDWLDFLAEEFGTPAEFLNRKRIEEGDILHFLLSKIEKTSAGGAEEAVGNALDFARDKFPWVENLRPYAGKIKRLVRKTYPFKIFDSPFEIYCEKEIVNEKGNTRRIDRLIVSNEKRKVFLVEYKISMSGITDYHKQVREYISLLQKLYKGFDIRGYILYLDEERLEEVKY